MVSRMLSTAYPDTLSSSMIGKGFERLFELVDEIEKDCPNANYIMKRGFYLPSGNTLSNHDIDLICKKLIKIVGE